MIFSFRETDDKDLGDACDSLLNWALKSAPRNHEGIVYHVPNRPEFWIDSMYMLPPYLAAAGHPEEALRQIYGYRTALFDRQTGLFSHKWEDAKQAFVRKAFWGVGNGWAAAGLARTIDLLPEMMSLQKQELVQIARSLIDCLLKYRRSDWLFHDTIDDPPKFCGSQFIANAGLHNLSWARCGMASGRICRTCAITQTGRCWEGRPIRARAGRLRITAF